MPTYTEPNNLPKELRDTKTAQNLHTAFSAEAQAYLHYKLFEKKADADGFRAVADLFAKTAGNERAHAEIWFRYLGGFGPTERNAKTAAGGERFEWESMYAQFAAEAREEGLFAIADLFDKVAEIEKAHEQNFLNAASGIESGTAFSAAPETQWICLYCGHVATGAEPPAICPVCAHPQGYFTEKTN